jgi:hypothetical protein
MNYTDFEKFFEQHIKEFLPFRDSQTYKELAAFLKNTYFSDSYSTIPANFKSLLESQVIPSTLYSTILLSLGFTSDIIRNCTVNQQWILLQQFGDYNRYKGSRQILETILTYFEERINIYELFIDYRNNDWHFLPWLIHSNSQVTPLTESLDFDEVVGKTKRFLITKSRLSSYKTADKIVLPIKSNLLYIQSEINLYVGYIENIIFTTVFHTYWESSLIYYSSDNIYTTNLRGLIQLWAYLLMRKTNNAGFPAITSHNVIFLDPVTSTSPFPYSLDPDSANYIETTLISDFNTISTIRERDAFYDYHIAFNFYKTGFSSPELTIEDIEGLFQSPISDVGFDLFEYIDNRINDASSATQEINTILEELRNSFLLWVNTEDDSILSKYYSYILRYLDALYPIVLDEESTIYKLIHFLKPMHTEIVLSNMSHITVQDIFNSLLLSDSVSFIVGDLPYYDTYTITDDYDTSVTGIWEDNYVITDDYDHCIIVMPYDDEYEITDSVTSISSQEFVSALSLFSDFSTISEFSDSDTYVITDDCDKEVTEIVEDDVEVTDDYDKCIILMPDSDTYVISDDCDESDLMVTEIWEDDYVITDDYDKCIIVMPDESLYTITDDSTTMNLNETVSALSLFDDFVLSQTYDGSFTFASSNIVQTDATGYSNFDVDDYIFSESDTSEYAQKIISKNLPLLQLTLENTYTGTIGLVSKAWKLCTTT